jgi:hypothetical protein
MDNKLSLEKITKGLQTAERIKQLFNSKLREDSVSSVKPDSLSVLRDTLQTITEFWPDIRGGSFNRALQQSNKYSGAYREIKSHLKNVRGQKFDINQLMNTFKVIMPVLDNRQKVPFDKIMKIIQVLNT